MSNRARRNAKALSLLIVWSIALGGLFAAIVAVSPAAQAGSCDQVVGVITGSWTVTTTQVCSGILYTVDGTVNINAGGSLTLINGGLSFSKDAAHRGYALNVNAGGELVLDNSIVTTQTDAIAPYLKLALTVSGANSRFSMRNGAVLKFPGWFNATGATINVTSSKITGFSDSELAPTGIYPGDNDNSPLIAWASTTATLYGSRIDQIYQNTSANGGGNVTGIVEGNVTLTASSNLYAYDSFIGVDYSNVVGLHNELHVDGTSNAYLYNVTIDRSQDPNSRSNWQPAYRPTAAGGSIFLLRWLHAIVVDSTGFPVSGATVWSTLSPSATTAQYPDNGLSSTPTPRTLWYLGRTSSGNAAWNRTDSHGLAVIPLYTDQITTASLPNAQSFGNYYLAVSYSTTSTSGGVNFDPYPAINWNDNNKWVAMSLSIVVRTGPDPLLRQSDYPRTLTVIQNQPFTVYALIFNQGQTTATGVAIGAYLDGNRASQLARVNGLTVAPAPSPPVNQSLSVAGVTPLGTHTIELIVDPDNTFNAVGAAWSNNFANITLNVLPPPNGAVAILSPSQGQTIEPGSSLVVTGYVRDQNSNGIVGVGLRITLSSGATVIATNQTSSQDVGFFIGTVAVPSNTADGPYSVTVTPSAGSISPDSRAITVKKTTPFLNTPVPILGLPLWLFLIILAAAVAVVIGVTLYWKVYGLGKMVECGECGAFIPEDATSCPKCGVEFERDMAKCSNCQAWIPVAVKQCPECGVAFATGEVEMADYQEKMRLQYDEVVRKFKDEAGRQLGRTLSDREFQEWWRKQPTFLTFEDWLREEEDMRKMGSKPCPVCGTLNSVTATVCHKCGSLMRETQRPPSGGGGGGVPSAPAGRRPGPAPAEGPSGAQGAAFAPSGAQAGAPGTEAIPRRVIRKPVAAQPVVQKKIIKKPEGEGQSGTSGENASEDEL